MALLEVSDLQVRFKTDDGIVHAVDGISYSLFPGKTLGIVGESGSGKTVSSLTALGLTRSRNASGEVSDCRQNCAWTRFSLLLFCSNSAALQVTFPNAQGGLFTISDCSTAGSTCFAGNANCAVSQAW